MKRYLFLGLIVLLTTSCNSKQKEQPFFKESSSESSNLNLETDDKIHNSKYNDTVLTTSCNSSQKKHPFKYFNFELDGTISSLSFLDEKDKELYMSASYFLNDNLINLWIPSSIWGQLPFDTSFDDDGYCLLDGPIISFNRDVMAWFLEHEEQLKIVKDGNVYILKEN